MYTFTTPKIYDALEYIMSYYPDKFTEKAKTEIEIFLDHCLEGITDDSEKFLSTLIIKALKNLIEPIQGEEHIYLKKYEIPQIELFNVLIDEFPFVKWGHELANTVVFDKLKDRKKAVILDVGIGQGIQIKNLLLKLAQSETLEDVLVVGVEPFGDALETAEKIIYDTAGEVPFNVAFTPIHAFVQDLKANDLKGAMAGHEGDVMVVSSLALHHIQTQEERLHVLNALRELNPAGIVLIEPNSDHFEPDFYQRFQNCYQHFYHIFKVVDNLSVDTKIKNGLKLFFGREIEDILGKEDNGERFEKHEPASKWIEKLGNCGFEVKNDFLDDLPVIQNGKIELGFMPEGFLGFTFETETVLSVIYAEAKEEVVFG
ncbi:GRAS family protein [Flammeovirgaceae bacterium SG7u.111]|nr:GRAS family protein [Flammeovirgaceae bacterium SG7u.132]WPO38743.1 GRAS family protein [Flammeovirgaceae bacterium SG7u.111]